MGADSSCLNEALKTDFSKQSETSTSLGRPPYCHSGTVPATRTLEIVRNGRHDHYSVCLPVVPGESTQTLHLIQRRSPLGILFD